MAEVMTLLDVSQHCATTTYDLDEVAENNDDHVLSRTFGSIRERIKETYARVSSPKQKKSQDESDSKQKGVISTNVQKDDTKTLVPVFIANASNVFDLLRYPSPSIEKPTENDGASKIFLFSRLPWPMSILFKSEKQSSKAVSNKNSGKRDSDRHRHSGVQHERKSNVVLSLDGVVTIDDLLIRIDQAIREATVSIELNRSDLCCGESDPSIDLKDLPTENTNKLDHKCIRGDNGQEESIQLLLDEIHTFHDIFTMIGTKPGHYKVLVAQGSTVDSCIGDAGRISTESILPVSTINNSEDSSIGLLSNQFVINELSITDASKQSIPIEGHDVWINIDNECTIPLLGSTTITENKDGTADVYATTLTENTEQSSAPITITKPELRTEF